MLTYKVYINLGIRDNYENLLEKDERDEKDRERIFARKKSLF